MASLLPSYNSPKDRFSDPTLFAVPQRSGILRDEFDRPAGIGGSSKRSRRTPTRHDDAPPTGIATFSLPSNSQSPFKNFLAPAYQQSIAAFAGSGRSHLHNKYAEMSVC